MNPRVPVAGIAVGLLISVAACGLKGPLYLPDKPGDVTIRPGPSAPATPTPATGTPSGEEPRGDSSTKESDAANGGDPGTGAAAGERPPGEATPRPGDSPGTSRE